MSILPTQATSIFRLASTLQTWQSAETSILPASLSSNGMFLFSTKCDGKDPILAVGQREACERIIAQFSFAQMYLLIDTKL